MYNKGAAAERELGKELWRWGFSIIRAAGSAVSRYSSPDLVAAKKGRIFAFECKARKDYVKLDDHELFELKEWCAKAGAEGFLAWKIKNRGWFFYNTEKITGGLSEKEMLRTGTTLPDFIRSVAG